MKICTIEGCTAELVAKSMCRRHYNFSYRRGDPNAPRVRRPQDKTGSLSDRLRAGTPTGLPDDECWEWLFAKMTRGYGQIAFEGREYGAHKVAYSLANKNEVPDGYVVRHSCDNPPCVNPAHLSVGTQADNIQDMVSRGRNRTKLRPEHIKRIREIHQSGGSVAPLAEEFGVSSRAVRDVVSGRTWKHI